ncbi:MAG TPA: hypothetical protein PLQ13_10770, partial [Candidatus Krumholzibacteria bacterium]|nr:hypothetical protein [Candidatus Krumholzibacteria bacterium]
MRLPLAGGEPELLREHPSSIDGPQVSPDGRLIAYRTWESGGAVLEVASYPDMGGRRLVAHSESAICWSPDGRRLYYISQEPFMVMVAEREPGDTFVLKETRALFATGPLGINPYGEFGVSPDDDAFVFACETGDGDQAGSFEVVENWYEEFRGQ